MLGGIGLGFERILQDLLDKKFLWYFI